MDLFRSIPHYLIDRDNALCDRPPEYTGSAGEHITWTVDAATGTLTFTGYGDADDVLYAGYHRFSDIITSVKFECTEGPITFIGSGAFEGFENLTELTLPEGLTWLGENIIKNSGVRVLTLPGTLEDFNSYALRLGTTPLQRIELSGESDIFFTEHGALYYYRSEGIEGTTLCKLPAEAVGYPLNDDLVQILYYAVEGFNDMTTFTIPGTVKYLHGDVCYDLPALQTVVLEPGEDALRSFLSADDFGGSTKVPSLVVSEEDDRFFVRDGVLYDKPLMQVRIVPENMTSLDLAEDIRSIYNYAVKWGDTFDRLTVRGDEFDFFLEHWRDSPVGYIDENTVLVCNRGSDAENYALRFGCRLEYLEDISITDVDIIADGPFEVYQYEEFDYKDLNVHAEVRYSDGGASVFSARDLFYLMDDDGFSHSGCSSYTYNELRDHVVTVRFGGVSETFPFSVVPSPATYRFDLSEAYTDFAVWEQVGESSLNAKLLRYDPRTDTESEVNIYNASLYRWNGADWTTDCCFTEPGPCRLKLEYRGFEQEFTVNVSTDEYLFTTNADEAVTEIPQFAFYTKAYGGNRLFVTHNGETTEITDRLTVCRSGITTYGSFPHIYNYDFEYPDTTVLGNSTYWLCADYYVYGSSTQRGRTFRVMMPLDVTVVPGDVVDAYLDISDVPEFVPAYSELTAGDLGIKYVKTMADGSVQIDEDPAVYFNWVYMPGTYSGETLRTEGNGATHYVKVHYGALTANFTVVMHAHTMTYVPADAGANCRNTGCIDHWHCTSCGRNYAEEEAVTELTNVSDGVYGPHSPGALHAGYAATCTENGLTEYCVCAVCGKLTDEQGNLLENPVIPAGHDYGEWIHENPPTCIVNGTVGHYTCALCGQNNKKKKEPINDLSIIAVGHDYVETARRDATCETAGSVTYTCRNDNSHTYTETLPATGHRHTELRGKIDATRDAHGHEAGEYCTDCGKYVSGGEDIHNKNGSRYRVQDATWLDEETYNYCCANGDYIIYCTVCDGWGLYKVEELRAQGIILEQPDVPDGGNNGGGLFNRIKEGLQQAFGGAIDFLLRLIKWFGNMGKK